MKKVNEVLNGDFWYGVRQAAGQSVLAAGCVGFISQNVENLTDKATYAVAGLIVFLVLWFANKK